MDAIETTAINVKKSANILMMISGIILMLGDIVLFLGVLFGGLTFYNVPFTISGAISNIEYVIQEYVEVILSGSLGVYGSIFVHITLLSFLLGLAIRLIIIFVKLFKLFKLKTEFKTALKNYFTFIKFAGGMYGVCGGTVLGCVAINSQLSTWGIVMIILAFAYVIFMTIVQFFLYVSAFGVKTSVFRVIGVLILLAVVVVTTVLYAKPVATTFIDLWNMTIPVSAGLIMTNISAWIKLFIAMMAGSMLSSVIASFTPTAGAKKRRSWGKGTFSFGIVFSIITVVMAIVEMAISGGTSQMIVSAILSVAPLFLCSVVALSVIDAFVKLKVVD